MSRKENKKSPGLLSMAAALVIISGLAASILGYVHQITLLPIQTAKDNAELEAISKVIGTDFDNNPFDERTTITTADGKDKLELYIARKDGIIKSFAIKTFSRKAFSGRIEVMAGFSIDGTVLGYEIISSQETPGLGSKVGEPKFKSQFKGMRPEQPEFKVRQDGGEIDAVTAATISSRAVVDAIQRAYDAYRKLSGGNSNE